MGGILPFLEASECDNVQLAIITIIYGYILFASANMIGDGSELLLLVPSLAGLVGSVVLPVLGAVPDGMMVLFSGLGPREEAQTQLNVGIGALAGSSIMLLTIPWFASALGGRVNIKDGVAQYQASPKLDPPGNMSLTGTGCAVGSKIRDNGIWMLVTLICFLFVQIPVTMHGQAWPKGSTLDDKAAVVSIPALCGLVACIVLFVAYLAAQMIDAAKQDDGKDGPEKLRADMVRVDSIKNGDITLRGCLYGLFESKSGLLDVTENDKERISGILKPFFKFYDVDRSGLISQAEFSKILVDLNEYVSPADERSLLQSADTDGNGELDFNEFLVLIIRLCKGEFKYLKS
jgi:Ca2+-binding EF-hand superfamily protein